MPPLHVMSCILGADWTVPGGPAALVASHRRGVRPCNGNSTADSSVGGVILMFIARFAQSLVLFQCYVTIDGQSGGLMAKRKKTANLPRRRDNATATRAHTRSRELALPSLPNWAQFAGPVALAVVLFVATLLRGLYFRSDQLDVGVAVLAIGAVALLVHRTQREGAWQISSQDLAVVGFLVFSWLSISWAAEARLALEQAIIYTIGGVIYLYARSRGEGRLTNALLWALGGLAVATWLMAGGLWNFPAAVSNMDRLSGPFQYPDTAGAVYLATWLGATAAQFASERMKDRYIWAAVGGLAAYLFALTLSRGAWVVAPFAVLAVLTVSRPGLRIAALAQMLVVGLLGFALAALTFPHFNNTGSHYAILFGFAAIVLGAIVWAVIGWLHQKGLDRWQVAFSALVIVAVLIGGALAYRARHGLSLAGQVTASVALPKGVDHLSLQLSGSGTANAQIVSLDRFGTQTTIGQKTLLPGGQTWTVKVPRSSKSVRLLAQGKGSLRLDRLTVYGQPQFMLLARAIPQSIYHRLIGISGTDLSVWERIDFWRDGMKMFAASPILGWGGNAWQAIYQGYQSFSYSSNQAHSSLVDAMVSYGIFGLVFVLAIAAAFVMGLRRAWGRGEAAGAALVTGLALWLHSLIDFDLSLAAVLLVLWLALGAMPQVRLFAIRRAGRLWPQVFGVAAGALAVWVVVLGVAAQTEAALKPPSLVQLRQAASLDPLSAQLQLEIARAELQQAGSAPSANALRQDAVVNARQAYKLNRYNQEIATLEAQMQIDQGDYAAAVSTLAVAQKDQPMLPNTYQNYLDLTTTLATHALDQHQLPLAKTYLRDSWTMYEKFLNTGEATQRVAPANLQLPPATSQLQLYAGEAAALLGGKATAIPLLQAAGSGGQPQAALWLAALGAGKATPGQDAAEIHWLTDLGVTGK